MKRAGLLALLVAGLVVAFVLAKGSSDGDNKGKTITASAGAPQAIQVVNGKPRGGVQKIVVNKGQRVRFSVTSDVADEVHVHGYDLHKDVEKGGSVSFDFPATIDGVFDIELESRSEQIASLQVNE